MRWQSTLLVAALLALGGCGEDDDSGAGKKPAREADPRGTDSTTEAKGAGQGATDATGTRITLAESEFGMMLFDSRKQAIYVFERDRDRQTVCYGDCAEAWPPVLTRGRPRAGSGVRASLLGTVRRRDGRRQVTYAGRPLYFYAHEQPGEVRCHNVDLNGGLWWVVGPDGRRRP